MNVFMYAGQGSQFAGMGKDLYERFPAFRRAAECADLDFDALQLMQEGPEEKLGQTEYTQPCMAIFAAGVTQILADAGIVPDATCGLSLGEYGALYAAGVWDTRTYIGLTAFRGHVMAEAVRGKQYCMSAILGADDEVLAEVCREISEKGFVMPVNYNCPGQTVICGQKSAVAAAESELREKCGAKAVRLSTTSPFHTPLLIPAGEALREKLRTVVFREPGIPVAVNATGTVCRPDEDLADLLVRQVSSPVLFSQDLAALMAAGADEFTEIGPGNVLTGLCRKTARSLGKKVRCRSLQKAEDIDRYLEEAGHE